MKSILHIAIAFSLLSVPQISIAQETARPAKVFTVEASDSVIRRSYPALVHPSREVELSFRVSGRVVELPARGSLAVATGDVIAQLDVRDFETQIAQLESSKDQSLAQLRALRSGARVEEVSALEAAVAAAQAQVDQAKDKATRTRELAGRGIVPKAQVETDDAALIVAEAGLRAELEQLAIGRAGGRPEEVEAAEAALRGLEVQIQVARDNLTDATLRAPFDGIIARRSIENFTNVQAGSTVALLHALSVVHLAFDVPGPDVTALTAGGMGNIKNTVIFDGLPGQEFEAEVVEFSIQADSATQTYRGRVAVEVPENATILPGMVGQVQSSAPGAASVIEVPLTSIAAGNDGAPFVWLVGSDDTVAKRTVTLGDITGEKVVVIDGLKPQDRIVSAGVSRILDGTAIRPITKIGG